MKYVSWTHKICQTAHDTIDRQVNQLLMENPISDVINFCVIQCSQHQDDLYRVYYGITAISLMSHSPLKYENLVKKIHKLVIRYLPHYLGR